MKTKLELADGYFKDTLAHMREHSIFYIMKDLVEESWDYADAMYSEMEKRKEWQPDWSQAPHNAKYWAMDADCSCNWYAQKPQTSDLQWDFGAVIESAPSFNYHESWQESLRERP